MNKAETLQKEGDQNTGSPTYQIITFTQRIKNLSQHLQSNHKDTTAKRGVHTLICKRKRMLKYLQRENQAEYKEVMATYVKRK